MGAVAALRRASGSPPPLSGSRQRLAQAIADRTAVTTRLAALETAQGRARLAWVDADRALATARQAAEEAAARAYEHTVAELLGDAAPAIPTRRQAAAALREAEEAAADAEAAAAAIAAEIERLRIDQRERDDAIEAAAATVMKEEMGDAAASLVAEIIDLHAKLVDRGRALVWLWRQNVVRLQGNAAFPGAPDARAALVFPPDQSGLWRMPHASPTTTKLQDTLARLMEDATAPVQV